MGLFSSSKSSSSSTVDNSATTAAGDKALSFQSNTGSVSYATSDPQVVKDALSSARAIAADALETQRQVFAIAKDAQQIVAGNSLNTAKTIKDTGDNALAAVLQAKTDAGQSERLLKIIGVAAVAAVALIVMMKKG